MEANLKAAEFEVEVLPRLARTRTGGKPLKPGVVKKPVRGKIGYKRAANAK